MKEKLKENDYCLVITIILTVVILAIGVFSIDYILNSSDNLFDSDDDIDYNDVPEYEDEINLLDEDGNFKKYYISVQDTNYSAEVEEQLIEVSDDGIRINSVEILSDAFPTKYVSFYDDYLILPYLYSDSWYGGLIIYNTKNGKHKIIDEVDGKFIVNTMESFTSSNDGIMINTSIVNENKIYIDGKEEDICHIKKSKKMKVQENIFFKYDKKKKKVITDKYDNISSMNLESYLSINEFC